LALIATTVLTSSQELRGAFFVHEINANSLERIWPLPIFHSKLFWFSLEKQITNQYENKDETNCITEDLGSNLSLYHAIPFCVRRNVGRSATLSANILADSYPGSVDRVCRRTIRGCNSENVVTERE
jgi:hypothetical protein